MSHDMRTPMTAIIGLVQLTLQSKELTPEIKENLEKIQSSGRYLMGLIDEVLETSRINAGKAVTVQSKDQGLRRPVCHDGYRICGEDPH